MKRYELLKNELMNWIYVPTGYTCKTRKEMKDYLGKGSFFNAAQQRKDVRFTNALNYIASDELQKNLLSNSGQPKTR